MTESPHLATDHSAGVHTFLQMPTAFPEKPSQIEVKETHISWVYLTDKYAYKQKKPVQFEFLDFSSLDQRKHYCQQELALNRRLSPDAYLAVVPVTCDAAGKYHLGTGHNVVEWLVKMVRLDDRNTLENVILRGELTESQIRQLSSQLAAFFAEKAPVTLRSEDFCRLLRHHVFANRDDLVTAFCESERGIQFAANSQARLLSIDPEQFSQRVCDGRVVDGHGDLRPEHIYLQNSKPTIIDCIEFNSEYRTNDVIDELAFLAMECDRLGAKEVGESLFQHYSQRSKDDPSPFLISFYKCYRACVRAKIAALRMRQQDGEPKSISKREVLAYLSLAKRYALELGGKLVIMVGGLSGSGKSTLAAALQRPLAAHILQTDVIRDELFDRSGPLSYAEGKYSLRARREVYDAMIDRIDESLQVSPTLILDGSFDSTPIRRAVLEAVRAAGARCLQIQCCCSPEEAAFRVSSRLARGNSHSEAGPDIVAEQVKEYEPILKEVDSIEVDTTHTIGRQVAEVVANAKQLIYD